MSSNNNCDQNSNCDCNVVLKEHLKKCVGMGQRPPPFQCCDIPKDADPCKKNDLSGPPACTGCSPAPSKCPCPPPPKKLAVFVPKCNVPPTATFKCPASCCEPPKPKKACCPPPPQTQCCQPQPKCPEVVPSDGKSGSGCGGCPKRKPTCGS